MNSLPIVLLAHPGVQHSYNLAQELHRHKKLCSFYTCLAIRTESKIANWMSPLATFLGMERQWQNRQIYGLPSHKLHCYPALDLRAWWKLQQGIPTHKVFLERNEQFQKRIPEEAIARSQIVVGSDTSSYILATRAKENGKLFILSQSIGHSQTYNQFAAAIKDRFPDWKFTWEHKTPLELNIEEEEYQLASIIVVPSQFVAKSLIANGVPANKIIINAFGTEIKYFYPVKRTSGLPLIFLFVGAICPRKGVPLLLEAWQQLKPCNAELWLAGTGTVPPQVLRQSPDSVRWLGAVSRQKLPSLLNQADVFVFPSLFEGLAKVQLEAAACGLPIIATTASGGEEIVEKGRTGFIIEPGNLEELMQSINKFLEYPELAKEMREYAIQKASFWSWSAYGDRWQKILQKAVKFYE